MDPSGDGQISFEELESWYFGAGDYRKRVKAIQAREEAENERLRKIKEAKIAWLQQLEYLRGVFRTVDSSDAGQVVSSDVGKLVQRAFGQTLSTAQLATATQAMDPKGTGVVAFMDFVRWCVRGVPANRTKESLNTFWVEAMANLSKTRGELNFGMTKMLRRWFREADSGQNIYGISDGELDRHQTVELLEFLRAEPMSAADVDRMCAALDPHCTNSIGFIEFREYYLYNV